MSLYEAKHLLNLLQWNFQREQDHLISLSISDIIYIYSAVDVISNPRKNNYRRPKVNRILNSAAILGYDRTKEYQGYIKQILSSKTKHLGKEGVKNGRKSSLPPKYAEVDKHQCEYCGACFGSVFDLTGHLYGTGHINKKNLASLKDKKKSLLHLYGTGHKKNLASVKNKKESLQN